MPDKPGHAPKLKRIHFLSANVLFWSACALFLLLCQFLTLGIPPFINDQGVPRIVIADHSDDTESCGVFLDNFSPQDVTCTCTTKGVHFFGFPFQTNARDYCQQNSNASWSLQFLNWVVQLGMVAVAYGIFVGTRRLLARKQKP